MRTQDIKKLIWAANVIVAALLALVAANVIHVGESAGAVASNASGALPSAQARTLTDDQVAFITNSGAIVQPSPVQLPDERPRQVNPIEAAANFEYKLIGTAIHPGRAFAFFEGAGGVTKVVTVGDKLGDAILTGINDDDAMLERAGQSFMVKREIRLTRAEGTGRQVASLTPRSTFPQLDNVTLTSSPKAPAEDSSGDEKGNEEKEGEEGEEELEDPDAMTMSDKQYKGYLDNIGKYLAEIVVLSHYGPDNTLDGLLLAKVPKESEAYKRGLREGDIVKTVQGVPITDTSTASKEAWNVQKNADYYLEIGIIRNGEEEILSYEIWPDEK